MSAQAKLEEGLRALIPYTEMNFVCSEEHLSEDPDMMKSDRVQKII